MINKKIQDAINDQINAELYSSYLYLSMVAYFESINLKGFANWMRVQVQEENAHAMKMYDYLIERGGEVILAAIDAPPTTWKSPVDVFEATYAHEQLVTSRINKIISLAMKEDDHATYNEYQWFVAEQVEEEANASGILAQLKLIDGNPSALFMIDRELATRVFTPIAPTA